MTVIKTILVHADADLAEPEVCDLDVSLLVQHDVVQLEVPDNYFYFNMIMTNEDTCLYMTPW